MDQTKDNSTSNAGRWSEVEHQRFVEALSHHGKNWEKVTEAVGSRTLTQVRSHAQKYFLKLEGRKISGGLPKPRPIHPRQMDPMFFMTKHMLFMQLIDHRNKILKRLDSVSIPIFNSNKSEFGTQDEEGAPYKRQKVCSD